MPENEILFEGEVDSEFLAEFADIFERYMDDMAVAAEQGFDKVDKRIEETGRKSAILGGIVAGLANQFVRMGLQAVAGIKNFVSSSIQLAARLDVLETVLIQVGGAAGYTQGELKRLEEEIKANGITTEAARQSMLLMIRANIDLAHASNLAAIAQSAAVIANMNSSQAFERLILGIQKGEPELLDELQITLDRERAYSSLATQLGVNKDALTEAQKQEAIIQDIYKQSTGIVGVYGAAMGDVGKQASSIARHVDTLKESIGRAFQDAYTEQIRFMTDMLIDLNTWFEENEEGVEEFGEMMTSTFKAVTPLLDMVIMKLIELPGYIKEAGIALGTYLGENIGGMEESQIQQNIDNMGESFMQLLVIVGGVTAGMVSTIVNLAMFAGKVIKNLVDLALQVHEGTDLEQLEAMLNADVAAYGEMLENIAADTLGAAEVVIESLYGVEVAAEAAAEAVEEVLAPGVSTPGALKQVQDIFDKETEKREEAAAKRALRASRDQTEREIKDSWRRQDIERKYQEGLDSIEEDAEEDREESHEDYLDARKEAAKNNSEDLVAIEERYQETLRDIQEDFDFNAGELARKRDAIGLLRLQRRKNKELKKADDNRKKARKKANKSYDEQLKDIEKNYKEIQQEIDDSVTEQLDSLEEARTKDYENYERSLDRQKILRDLHEQWKQEDRDEANRKWLEDQGNVFLLIEGLTFTGLQTIASLHEDHYGDMTEMYREFLRGMTVVGDEWEGTIFIPSADIYDPDIYGGGGAPSGGDIPEPEEPDPDYPDVPYDEQGRYIPGHDLRYQTHHINEFGPDVSIPDVPPWPSVGTSMYLWYEWFLDWFKLTYGPTATLYGQAGQISSMLANIGVGGMPNITIPNQEPSRLAAVAPSSTTDRREIHITADLLGVDPYIQQSVINTMLEIERNRGSGS